MCREKNGGAEFYVGLYALAGIFLSLAGLEIISGSIDPLKSDELFYIETATSTELSELFDKKRALWHGVNYWVLNVDIGLNGLALKVVNIPFYALLIYCLFRIFDRRKIVWLLPIFLPYSLWVSTFNLRDVPILLTTTLVAFLYAKPGAQKYYAIVPLILLFMLRPFAAFVLGAIVGAVELMRLLRGVFKGIVSKRAVVGMAAGSVFAGLVIIVFWEPILEVSISYYRQFIFTTGEGRVKHLDRIASAYKSQNILKDLVVSMVRYAATPIPTSMLERAMSGGSEMWGLVDDVVRLVHQTVYYGMIIYLVAHWQTAISVLRALRKEQTILVLTFLAYWPIYSFHLYGVTHQRSKLPLQIVVFLIVMLVWGRRSSTQSYKAVIEGR
ncbi:MAG: hypothetical protein OES10_15380 [Gammaproteobacteria bacterium]|nr:hypothetical protein [Gammaproteobacteria bacterium]